MSDVAANGRPSAQTHSEQTRSFDEPVVSLLGVSKRWPARTWLGRRGGDCPEVLTNVSFAAGRGEIVVVLGENGAGKTTLLKIVAGLARADAGRVRLFGSDASAPAPAVRRRVAYAGGERGFYVPLSARENLDFFGALDAMDSRRRARRIVEVARALDIERDLDRSFANLSSGQRQRLAIARALLSEPDVLLLDEPTRALDPVHASDLRRFVRETLAAGGKTIIVATNLIDEALELAGRIAILRAGTFAFVDLPSRRSAERESRSGEREIRTLFGLPSRA